MKFFQYDIGVLTASKLAKRAVEQRLGRNVPLYGTFFVTRRCNVRCDGCNYYESLDPNVRGGDPTTEQCIEVLRRLAEGGIPVVQLAGGEPFLRNDLAEIVRAGRRLGLAMATITNGLAVSEESLAAIDESCEWLLFSPHVPSELGGRRATETYEEAWEGLRALRAGVSRPKLYCAVTVSRHTVPLLDEIMERAVSIGVDAVKFQPMFLPELFPDPDEIRTAVETIRRWKRRHPRQIAVNDAFLEQFATFFGEKPVVECTTHRYFHVAVHTDGSLSACCTVHVPVGNIFEAPLLEQLEPGVETRTGCHGCQRLDISTALKVCGRRPPDPSAPVREATPNQLLDPLLQIRSASQ